VGSGFHRLLSRPPQLLAGPPARRDVLDLTAGRAADALDEVHPLPARTLALEGRDDDLVGRVVLDRVLDAREGSVSMI
jgi:hypothetical protein